jgi:hypothetical protein
MSIRTYYVVETLRNHLYINIGTGIGNGFNFGSHDETYSFDGDGQGYGYGSDLGLAPREHILSYCFPAIRKGFEHE